MTPPPERVVDEFVEDRPLKLRIEDGRADVPIPYAVAAPGWRPPADLTLLVVGRLTVLRSVGAYRPRSTHGKKCGRLWECRCRCGKLVQRTAGYLLKCARLRFETTCGCGRRDRDYVRHLASLPYVPPGAEFDGLREIVNRYIRGMQ